MPESISTTDELIDLGSYSLEDGIAALQDATNQNQSIIMRITNFSTGAEVQQAFLKHGIKVRTITDDNYVCWSSKLSQNKLDN